MEGNDKVLLDVMKEAETRLWMNEDEKARDKGISKEIEDPLHILTEWNYYRRCQKDHKLYMIRVSIGWMEEYQKFSGARNEIYGRIVLLLTDRFLFVVGQTGGELKNL